MRTPRLVSALHTLTLSALAAACAPDSPTDAGRSGRVLAARATVPFRFQGITFSSPPTTDPRCPELIVHVTTEGQATHLGRFTGAVSHCVRDGSLDFTDGRLTFTAANGDELRGTHFGTFVPTSEPGIFTFTGRIAFVGGTGRFAAAAGDAALNGRIDMSTGVAAVSIDGQLT